MNGDGHGPSETRGSQVPEVGPVPTTVVLGECETPIGRFVMLQFHTRVGSSTFFLDPETAAEIGGQVVELANKPSSGLIIPHLHVIPPPEDLTGGPPA